mmetsp:Transcript_19923/g.37156  ORF Transcript_19923/g.37156 Transcript_19923/m.37156 type:complete len:426 (+) Transcript_19923:128-1405(+)|eukprot:CAMPEP_0182495868 /NCGR_PEP_ID=MMETSP1321-20130603/4591_1 /TAXON_ID=91990 /ORGANISM="Bolidomonas sp., Strain RCC1657" /LENGTH=425 /DNA_ID=CAMNT_0024699339 /DNA_START=85 /DNA_END=1365 /DNA_ORIENTATION=+
MSSQLLDALKQYTPPANVVILGTTYTVLSVALSGLFSLIIVLWGWGCRTPKSPKTHDPRSARYRAIRRKHFPPPYPNGWFHVCNAADVAGGNVHSISALGLDLVAFRGQLTKEVAILKAHCPHLGAHLGEGGEVIGDSVRCPFHGWEIDGTGSCTKIPYSKMQSIPSKCKTDTYACREIMGAIWMWFDAEGRDPLWELDEYKDVQEKGMTLRVVKQNTFYQHIAEMCENSADPYHFQTLHAPLPIPGFSKVVGCQHRITQKYPDKVSDAGQMHKCHFTERMYDLELLGGWRSPGISLRGNVPLSARILDSILTTVCFEGPGNISFSISTPIGEMRMFMTNLPLEPFKQHVENHWFAPWYFPTFLVRIFATLSAHALEQDRQVWENKVYRKQMNLVGGDGPFPAFRRYWAGHYSKSSEDVGKDPLN